MFGLNANDDSRPVITGDVDAHVRGAHPIRDKPDLFLQGAVGKERVSGSCNFNVSALVGVGAVKKCLHTEKDLEKLTSFD